jgi:hypothetical protein
MKSFRALIVVLFCLLLIQPAWADCVEIKREINTRQTAFIIAKTKYQNDTAVVVGAPFSEASIAKGIASGRAMKEAIDKLVDVLNRSIAEGCLGGDAAVWRDLVVEMKSESAAIEKTIQRYLEMQAGNAKQ